MEINERSAEIRREVEKIKEILAILESNLSVMEFISESREDDAIVFGFFRKIHRIAEHRLEIEGKRGVESSLGSVELKGGPAADLIKALKKAAGINVDNN